MVEKNTADETISIGSQAWNVADGYTKLKILRLLLELDYDQRRAIFGKIKLEDEVPLEQIPYKRLEGLKSFIFHLRQLIGNCEFAIKNRKDMFAINDFYERISKVEKYFDAVSYYIVNHVTKENELVINERHFKLCFDILSTIKNQLNFKLDNADLIFRHSQELDLNEIMKEIEEGV